MDSTRPCVSGHYGVPLTRTCADKLHAAGGRSLAYSGTGAYRHVASIKMMLGQSARHANEVVDTGSTILYDVPKRGVETLSKQERCFLVLAGVGATTLAMGYYYANGVCEGSDGVPSRLKLVRSAHYDAGEGDSSSGATSAASSGDDSGGEAMPEGGDRNRGSGGHDNLPWLTSAPLRPAVAKDVIDEMVALAREAARRPPRTVAPKRQRDVRLPMGDHRSSLERQWSALLDANRVPHEYERLSIVIELADGAHQYTPDLVIRSSPPLVVEIKPCRPLQSELARSAACAKALGGLGLVHVMLCGRPCPPVCPVSQESILRERFRTDRYETLVFTEHGTYQDGGYFVVEDGQFRLKAGLDCHYDGTSGVVYPDPASDGSSSDDNNEGTKRRVSSRRKLSTAA